MNVTNLSLGAPLIWGRSLSASIMFQFFFINTSVIFQIQERVRHPSMPLSSLKETLQSKHKEVATRSIIAETSSVEGSACPTVQA